MTTSIDARDRDVQSAFEKAHAIARGKTSASLHEVETSLWTALLALGRAMIALYLARVAARPRATEYVHNGSKFVLAGSASDEIGTRFGKVFSNVRRRSDRPKTWNDWPILSSGRWSRIAARSSRGFRCVG